MSSKGLTEDALSKKKEPLEQQFAADVESGFSMMQHLIDEMDRSSQRIDEYNTGQYAGGTRSSQLDKHQLDLLYDEAWKSEDSDAVSLKEVPSDYFDKDDEEGCDDAVTSAIAEVSKDFLAGLRAAGARAQSGDSDDSHISSDTEFKRIQGRPAYARYPETAAGLSDNDWNPYGTESDTNISPRVPSQETPGIKLSGSKLSTIMSFNPPLHSSDLGMTTPSSAIGSIPNTGARSKANSEILEMDNAITLKPDLTADFSTISHMSEQTMGSYVAPPPEPLHLSDLNKTMREDKLISNDRRSKPSQNHTSSKASEFKTIGQPIVLARDEVVENLDDIVDQIQDTRDLSSVNDNFYQSSQQTMKTLELDQGNVSEEDYLGQKVKKVLSDTKYLEAEPKGKKTMHEVAIDYQTLQRDLQEIQDSLHHNFGSSTGSTVVAKNVNRNDRGTPPSSDNDGEIVPSTTTTPERKRTPRMAWDLAEDLASEDMDRHLYGNSSGSQRPSREKQPYNSDGDETRTSGSSDKLDDHAAADQALAEMSAILTPHPQLVAAASRNGGIHSTQDVDQMLSNFRNQRMELESRYQQLSNPGLAEKVFRILTNQDPEAQANGILSNVGAQEQEQKAKYVLGVNNRLNFSSTDTDNPNTSGQSFVAPDDVRKRLDLSGLSSAEGSRLADKSSSFALPNSKGFSAFDGMTKFLSSQMAKASERTFNHSLELQLPPQVTTCYPLLADYKQGKKQDEDTNQGTATSSNNNQEQDTEIHAGNPEEDQPTATSSPVEIATEAPKDASSNHNSSPEDSDTSSGRRKEKFRPYRPPGSKDFYYTESDAASVADSVTTMESTHIGSDDARGPALPTTALGSRKDPLHSGGIYAKQKLEEGMLPPIQEKSISDDRDSDPNASSKGSGGLERNRDLAEDPPATAVDLQRGHATAHRIRAEVRDNDDVYLSSSRSPKGGVAAARRDAQWENREKELGKDYQASAIDRINRIKDRFPELDEAPGVGREETYLKDRDIENRQRQEERGSRAKAEPLSLRVRMSYRPSEDTEVKRTRQADEERERRSRRQQEARERYLEEEKARQRHELRYSPTGISPERHRDRASSHSDTDNLRTGVEEQDAYTRDARLSPAFHRALSADLRQAIERRSPLLSQNIERSLAQAPLDPPARRSRDSKRDHSPVRSNSSPPPTFLARERGQLPRSYARSPVSSGRRSPPYSSDIRQEAWAEELTASQQPRSSSHQPRAKSPVNGSQQATIRLRSPGPISLEQRARSPNEGHRSPSPSGDGRVWSPVADLPRWRSDAVGVIETGQRSSPPRSTENMKAASRKQASSPHRRVEQTLENMTSESEDTEIDREPLSRRAQMLTAALPQEQGISPDINTLWDRFKALNEDNDSSMNSPRMEAVTDLLRNPSQHLVAQYLKEREDYRIERQERAEVERERRLKEQQAQHSLSHLHSSSEDDFNCGGYRDMLAKKEEERIKRRAAKKKKGSKQGEDMRLKGNLEGGNKNKENVPDSLFSIPEDAGPDHSPTKGGSASTKSNRNKMQSKPQQQQHMIDPNMQKLREKIARQRGKIDKQTLKEIQRVEKLKKLQQLLSAKTKDEISDQTLQAQMEEVSTTSTPSSNHSQENNNNIDDIGENSTPMSEDSTTAKDSSAEMHAWKAEKERRVREMRTQLAEMERRRAFMTGEGNRNTNRKPSAPQRHKGKRDNSELKLLRLVSEGYLSGDEAYRLAKARAHKQGLEDPDSSTASFSSVEKHSMSSRPHRLYSPYTRQEDPHAYRHRHVPKLKQVSPTMGNGTNFTYPPQSTNRDPHHIRWDEEDDDDIRPSRSPSPKFLSKSKVTRPSSRSPNALHRNGMAQTLPQRSTRSAYRADGKFSNSHRAISPPQGKRLQHHHHHTHQQLYGERYPTWQESRGRSWTAVSEDPPPKGVSWHIPIDLHPNKWDEPPGPDSSNQGQKHGSHKEQSISLRTKEYKAESNRGKVRKQLPLPCDPRPLEEGEEPLQRWDRKDNALRGNKPGFWHKADHPQGIPQELWEEVVSRDALASKTNHMEVDPLMDRVQYILNKDSPDSGPEGPVPGMTLQDAFLARKQIFISKCRERQKRIALAREDRHLQECLRLEREAIFAECERPLSPNLYAHPVSENLYQPKRRVISKSEMKAITQRRYKKLQEVIQKQEKQKTEAEHKLNRLRVRMFNKKVQRGVLRKSSLRRR